MRALVTGAGGQLGQELLRLSPGDVECVAVDKAGLDLTRKALVLEFVQDLQPQVIFNCAGYTAVDGAETKPDLALEVNAGGIANLAVAAQQIGARVLHVSTDFVFDGEAVSPYLPEQETRPLGIYGHSKLAGENRLMEILPMNSLVLRTAWLYSSLGNNFVNTMLRLMNERESVAVVSDQLGAPTWARGLADALWRFLPFPGLHGVYHWTDNGSCSWYQFALEIFAQGRELGLVKHEVKIEPITTAQYPTPARRPAYSVLDCERTHQALGVAGVDWRRQLAGMLGELAGV